MKTTLMKTTWWCLASPGAAPTAVGADSRESEPRRQGGMYGTLVEMASTPLERAHRWLTPLKEVPGGKRAAVDRSCGPIAKRASWGRQIQRSLPRQPKLVPVSAAQLVAGGTSTLTA